MTLFLYAVYYGSYLLIPLVLYLVARHRYLPRRIKRRNFIYIAFCLLVIYSRFIEPNFLTTKEVSIDSDKLAEESVRIAVVSDLHMGIFLHRSRLEKVMKKLESIDYDFLIIPGDILFRLDMDDLAHELEPLRAIQKPTFIVYGNHDDGYTGADSRKELRRFFEGTNIHILDDESLLVNYIHDTKIQFIGISDLWLGNSDTMQIPSQETSDLLIAISHNPDIAYLYKNGSPDLLISGHTHGGQIRIPFIYKWWIPTENDFDRGLYEINDSAVYVSSGLGMVWLPFRFLIPPAIDILNVY